MGQRNRDRSTPPVDSRARSFAGTLGTKIYQTAPRDPETKGAIERANGFFETSFMPGRSFTSPADYNIQLADWLPTANSRVLRRTGEPPGELIGDDTAGMNPLPPIPPVIGTVNRVRLARDYYVRIGGNDYSVDPSMIGRFVDVHAGLTRIHLTCDGTLVGSHERCSATHQTVTDPVHVTTAGVLRTAFKERTAALRGPAAGPVVGLRSLTDYDDLFALTTPAATRPDLRIVR